MSPGSSRSSGHTGETRERRLVFGEDAALYDAHRPSYPGQLVDDLVTAAALDGSRAVLEVGAGTGKATAMFAARGIPVVAIEPSAQMIDVARQRCHRMGAVEFEHSDFETWGVAHRRFPLLFSAQAWHWIDPGVGYRKAVEALSAGGLLAAFWNRVNWSESDMREALLETYEQTVPDLRADGHLLHPGNLNPDADADWEGEIAAVDQLGDPEIRYYAWQQTYTASDYVGLMGTLSEIRLLEEGCRSMLLEAVHSTICAHGGSLMLPMRTRLCLARRA